MFKRILIANRGEIACRIARTCRRLGIDSVAVHSRADVAALHVRATDRAVALDGAGIADGYLDIAQIVDAARRSGAEAIHPGYGFLAENAGFAAACTAAGLRFIGPDTATIRSMGDKAEARRLARAAGVPVVQGIEEAANAGGDRDATLCAAAAALTYPLMVKACAGGGGRGMRRVAHADALPEAIALARREALAGFGSDALIVERCIERPRHVEVQILGDAHGTLLHLHERDCSTQRRHQKLIEEAPAPGLHATTRAALHQAALTLARAIGYQNAGTVEFILDTHDQSFFFLEVNTRLQVEHPVTEAILDLDLVEWQIRIAAGEALPFTQEQLQPRGWAMEARINAEDPATDFAPATGTALRWQAPQTPGARLDSGVEQGSPIAPWYDSLLGKLIVHGRDRADATAQLAAALESMSLMGVRSNIAFLAQLLRTSAFRNGQVSTALIPEQFPGGWQAPLSRDDLAMAAAVCLSPGLGAVPHGECASGPWHGLGAFRLLAPAGFPGRWRLILQDGTSTPLAVWIASQGHALHMLVSALDAPPPDFAQATEVSAHFDADTLELRLDGRPVRLDTLRMTDAVHLHGAAGWHAFRALDAAELLGIAAASHVALDGPLLAPVPGVVASVEVRVGERVAAGAALVVLESMKMYQTVRAPVAAEVVAVHCAAGDAVTLHQPLIALQAPVETLE